MSTSARPATYPIYIRDYNPDTDKKAAFALLKEALGSGPARDYLYCNPPFPGYTAVGVDNNAIVGVLIYRRDSASKSRKWPLTGEAPCLGVNKHIRNAQIGSRLMDHFHRSHSTHRIGLTPMPPKNAAEDRASSVGQKPPLIRFYERLGSNMTQRTVIQVLLVTSTGGYAETLPQQARMIEKREGGVVTLLDD